MSEKGTVITLILAPVSFLKSGARRCSGSAICGPVNVRRLTVTPAKGWAPAADGDLSADLLLLLLLQAATTSTATARNASHPYRFIPDLRFARKIGCLTMTGAVSGGNSAP